MTINEDGWADDHEWCCCCCRWWCARRLDMRDFHLSSSSSAVFTVGHSRALRSLQLMHSTFLVISAMTFAREGDGPQYALTLHHCPLCSVTRVTSGYCTDVQSLHVTSICATWDMVNKLTMRNECSLVASCWLDYLNTDFILHSHMPSMLNFLCSAHRTMDRKRYLMNNVRDAT